MTAVTQPVRSESGPIRLAGTLGVAGLLAGLLLVFVYELTLPRIEANRAAALRRAVLEVLPGSSTMQKLLLGENALIASDGSEAADALAVFAGYDASGAFCGYAIRGAGPGFQDVIRLLYGFDPARRRIVGMRVLESRETPGLGDKIFKDAAFAKNFDDLAVEPSIVVVKNGQRARPNEVDAITGATISSKAVVRILNAANTEWLERLPPAGAEPALPGDGR